jgi:hypothetical protein
MSTALCEPLPEPSEYPFRVVQPFPILDLDEQELVVPPREYRSLTQHPSVKEAT